MQKPRTSTPPTAANQSPAPDQKNRGNMPRRTPLAEPHCPEQPPENPSPRLNEDGVGVALAFSFFLLAPSRAFEKKRGYLPNGRRRPPGREGGTCLPPRRGPGAPSTTPPLPRRSGRARRHGPRPPNQPNEGGGKKNREDETPDLFPFSNWNLSLLDPLSRKSFTHEPVTINERKGR
ncbi:uncharacterized protein TM35_000101860 [Trypanosoma theileri]|uniref:Uncharacterized protein n=1 Tax=Trypanosoma theileri TaxID=67003 RepID=A0A1X0NZE3_9TRYP|nr:uncharacterized protein TM35_000101860 [Trypanosoma theileri]ORC89918.1 hypothetical protein TM35_000101860 [Trypanosoma theileri]